MLDAGRVNVADLSFPSSLSLSLLLDEEEDDDDESLIRLKIVSCAFHVEVFNNLKNFLGFPTSLTYQKFQIEF